MRKLRILLCVIAPAWALGALLPAPASAALDMFLQADGFIGESQADKYKDQIDILAWSWGMSNPNGSKANFQDVNVTKYLDRSSPVMLSYLASGRAIPRAKLTVVKAGENAFPYLRLCFTGLKITSVSTGGSGGEDRLTENVSFNYSTVVEAYQQSPTAQTVFGGWDVINRIQYGDQAC